ncbi:Sulfhydryl oxidase 2-like protein [Drosera capensis]
METTKRDERPYTERRVVAERVPGTNPGTPRYADSVVEVDILGCAVLRCEWGLIQISIVNKDQKRNGPNYLTNHLGSSSPFQLRADHRSPELRPLPHRKQPPGERERERRRHQSRSPIRRSANFSLLTQYVPVSFPRFPSSPFDSMYLVIVLLILSRFGGGISIFDASPIGLRSLLRAIPDKATGGIGGGVAGDYSVELNETNFDAFLGDSPASFAVVEFFAHWSVIWCPACRNYKPHYEKVARLFNGPDAPHPGIILMARVDCALKMVNLTAHLFTWSFLHLRFKELLEHGQINSKLCDRFSVGHFPMLLWGPPSKFASGGFDFKNYTGIKSIDDGRTAERLLNWINTRMSSSFSLIDSKYDHGDSQSNSTELGEIQRAIHDVEEATATAFDIILERKMINADTRSSLIRFLQLLVAHHPSRSCRNGGAEMLVNFDDLFPSKMLIDKEKTLAEGMSALGNFHVCGKGVPRSYWMFCRGSTKDTRGFSCGLWVMMHAISVRIDDRESHIAFTTMCDFIHNFFICEECRTHFYAMCSRVSTPFNTTRDFALWLWTAHNTVNERLMKEEASLETADPKYPKLTWPPKSLCPSCYLSVPQKNNTSGKPEWNFDEVFKFLVVYYGKKLFSSQKGLKTLKDEGVRRDVSEEEVVAATNAVVVPIGAAMAIAVASCAFGALACVWRSRQKSRKTTRSLN